MKVVRKDHSNLMVLFIDQLFHSMMQPCTELNTHRKELTHVQLHFLSEFHLFFGMIFFIYFLTLVHQEAATYIIILKKLAINFTNLIMKYFKINFNNNNNNNQLQLKINQFPFEDNNFFYDKKTRQCTVVFFSLFSCQLFIYSFVLLLEEYAQNYSMIFSHPQSIFFSQNKYTFPSQRKKSSFLKKVMVIFLTREALENHCKITSICPNVFIFS
jgi:hypothetical protein